MFITVPFDGEPTFDGMTERNPYWDIVRGSAILLVILGHSLFIAKGLDDPVHVFIYSFHMPLFMIVSGYFFHHSLHHSTKYIIWKRFFQLAVPVLLVGTIDWFSSYLEWSLPLKENLINWFARIIRTLWFLQALFIGSMIVLVGDRLLHKKAWLFYVALLIIFLLTPDKLQQSGTKAMFPFFVAGFYLHQLSPAHLTFIRKNEIKLLCLFLLLFAGLLIPFRFPMTHYESGVYIFNPDFTPGSLLLYNTYRILVGCAGSATILLLIHTIRARLKNPTASKLAVIGHYTLWLYITSYYLWIGYIIWFKEVTPQTYWAAMLIFFGLFLLSFPLSVLFDKLWTALDKKLIPQE